MKLTFQLEVKNTNCIWPYGQVYKIQKHLCKQILCCGHVAFGHEMFMLTWFDVNKLLTTTRWTQMHVNKIYRDCLWRFLEKAVTYGSFKELTIRTRPVITLTRFMTNLLGCDLVMPKSNVELLC